MNFKTQSDFLKKINEWNFSTNPLSKIVKNLKEVQDNYLKIDQMRSS